MASAKPTCMRSLLSNLVENDELGKIVIAIRALIVNNTVYGPNKVNIYVYADFQWPGNGCGK